MSEARKIKIHKKNLVEITDKIENDDIIIMKILGKPQGAIYLLG